MTAGLLLIATCFTLRELASRGAHSEPFFEAGCQAQAVALITIIAGYAVLALFLLIGAPLALFVPVRLTGTVCCLPLP